MTVITRLFDTYEHASNAVQALETGGIPHTSISILANGGDSTAPAIEHIGHTASASASEGAGAGATLGTVLGGGAGLLAGLGMLAIPGVGPVVAAGWLVATAVGAGVGAASGGLLGSLVGAGVNEDDAHVYAEGVRRGGSLVTVQAENSQTAMVNQVLNTYAPVDMSTRSDSYRAEGWTGFDETAPAYVAGGSPMAGTSPTTRATLPL